MAPFLNKKTRQHRQVEQANSNCCRFSGKKLRKNRQEMFGGDNYDDRHEADGTDNANACRLRHFKAIAAKDH